ncbi:ogr/Delta-like zinc finger family protein [Pseudomonas sp. D47]|uniref:ogr/Delta-like zinc finger family protein n=1 Tax=Pseudomonas sp. D47 TaxID=3159447 RepID=UPI00387A8E4D
MRINCRYCGNKAHISRAEKESSSYAKLYCICLEPNCAHSFVSELSFSHTLKPSKILPAEETILDRISKLTGEQQKQLLEQLDML